MPLLRTTAAVLAAACLFAFTPPRASGATPPRDPAPSASDLAKAELIITKLRRLAEATEAAQKDSRAYESVVKKLYPGLFAEVGELGEGDLKTDLATAVFLYESASRAPRDAVASGDACRDEVRDVYLRLCRENAEGGRASVLWAKARLHARWGEGALGHALGRRDSETLKAVSEMRAERAVDLALAARAVAALKGLEGDVNAYRSLAEYEEGRAVAAVSFERFSEKAADAFRTVDRLLASLPRGPARRLIHNARNSYRDGLFWWRKTQRRNSLTVSADALAEEDPLGAASIDATAADYTIVVNWRSALKYTAQAERLVRASDVESVAFRDGR